MAVITGDGTNQVLIGRPKPTPLMGRPAMTHSGLAGDDLIPATPAMTNSPAATATTPSMVGISIQAVAGRAGPTPSAAKATMS